MTLLALSLGFGIFCSVVGASWIFLLRPRAPLLRSWLISPAVGIALIVLSVMILNQAGLPVNRFARPLAAVMLLAAGAVLYWRKVHLPFVALLPVMAGQLAGLILTGWPAFEAGLHWVGYGNVDMLGYVYAAQRQMESGFYASPAMSALRGLDYTQYYWFYHVPGFVRFGSENIVAFVASAAGLKPLEAFMPALLALGAMQISGIAALVLHRGRYRRWSYLAALALLASPFFHLSVGLQVIAQVGGISLLLAVCSLAAERLQGRRFGLGGMLRRALLLAPAVAGFLVFYPELLPFCAAVLFLTHALAGLGWKHFFRILVLAAFTGLGALLLLRQNILSAAMTLLFHGGQGTASAAADVVAHPFGIALLPSALPALLGISNLFAPPAEPWLSLLIATATIMGTAIGITSLAPRQLREPSVLLFLVMCAVGVTLHLAPSPFGVFKLSMFIQPALAACLAAAALQLRWYLGGPALLVLFLVNFQIGQQYLQVFSGRTAYGSFLPFRSAEPIDLSAIPAGSKLAADTPSMAYDHLLGLQLRGRDLHYMNRDGISGAVVWALNNDPRFLWPALTRFLPAEIGRTAPYQMQLEADTYHQLDVFDAEMTELGQPPTGGLMISVRPPFSHFNNLHAPGESLVRHSVFVVRPLSAIRNHLVFLNTTRSNDYYSYLGSLRRAYSYYQFEQDPMRRSDRPFYAIGRYFVFEVINPDDRIRLRVSFSRTLLGAGQQQLPGTVQVAGQETLRQQLYGAGACNFFTEPLVPFRLGNRHFVAVDLNCEPMILRKAKSPLMALYHSSTALDWRHVAGYGRDISVATDAEYNQLQPPGRIESFPEDLIGNPAVEFSGLYEDGWVSPQARITLGATKPGMTLRIVGEIPDLPALGGGDDSGISILINGQAVAHLPLRPGRFEKNLAGPVVVGRNLIEMRAKGHFLLPSPDDRPASFRLVQMRLD